MLLVVFLMGLHATIFGPAKYGIVPEMLGDRDLSRGNALLEMSTFVAIVLGIAGGGVLFAVWSAEPWRIGAATIVIAAIGFTTSLRITRVPASGATQPFRWNPFGEIAGSTRHLLHDKPLWLAVLGVSYFWFAGVLLKTDLQYFGKDVLRADDNGVSLLWAFLAIGIGAGNMLAGRLSGDKVELGLVPMGAAFMGFFALALVRRTPLLRPLHRRRGLPRDVERPLRRPALRLHPAAQRLPRERPRRRRQQLLPDHRHADGERRHVALLHPPPLERHRRSCSPSALPAPGHRLHRHHRPRLPGPLRPLAAHPQPLPHPHQRPGKRALPRARAARRQPHVACRWPPDRRQRAALHPLHGVEAHLRNEGAPLAPPPHQRHPGGRRRPPRHGGIHPRRAPRNRRRPHRLHLRRGRHQPHRQHAPLQTRHGENRRRHRRAHHSRAPRSPVGQHLQLRQRQILLEVAHPNSLSRDRHLRRAHASQLHRASRTPGHPGTLRRSHRPPQAPRRLSSTAASIHAARRNWSRLRHGRHHRPLPHLRRTADRRRDAW